MTQSRGVDQAARVEATARNLRIDSATAEVLRAFDAASIRGILLKGPALTAWYPEDPAHSYLDCDIWIAPTDVDAAGEALSGLGFERLVDDRSLPAWWREHDSNWRRDLDGVVVDLHRRLQGVGVDDETAWRTLSATFEAMTIAGHPAPVLSVPARALYVTLHAAHHGMAWGKALSHVERRCGRSTNPHGWKRRR